MDFANTTGLPVSVWTHGEYGSAPGARAVAAGGIQAGTLAWGTANLAVYCPIFLPFRYPVRNLFVYNFATINGNVDVGIYNSDYVKITPAVTTAQAGATGLQFFAVDVILDPGQYYLAMSSSSTTATFAVGQAGTATRYRYLGVTQQATAHPLPASATPVAIASARLPAIGITYLSGTPAF